MSMFDQIVAFTSRSQGATCAEIAVFVGRDNDSAGSYVRRLEQQGRLFRAKSGRQHLRFFSDKGACAAWLAAEDLKPAEVKVTTRSASPCPSVWCVLRSALPATGTPMTAKCCRLVGS